ncbi:pimeloyl-ACP methyl ester carboxylesterase [Bradyrhizobium sp. AZCC 2262]
MKKMMTRFSLLVFLLVAATPLRPAAADELWQTLPPTPAAVSGGSAGFADVNGIRLFYAEIGVGPPVVLLHGGLANSDYFGNQARALAQAYRVILVDSRGHGRSTRDQRPFGYDLMADDVVALLDTLKIDKAAILGWSDGAIIGLDLAMRHPERVSRVFAFGGNTSVSGLKDDFEKNPTFAAFVARANREYAQLSATPEQYTTFRDQIGRMWEHEPNWTDTQLREIRTPVWVVDGEHDEGIKREHTEHIAATIPGARLLILANVSHFAFLQDPITFNNALLSFLGEQQPSASTLQGAHP